MPKQGERWFDQGGRLWAITKVDEKRIEAIGPRGVMEFFHNTPPYNSTSTLDPGYRLLSPFVDEHAPQPRKKADVQDP